ncbi:MAG: fibronectin type III domain-containing protein, partial [Gemmatimonadota bacterium]|nr:fibronectin type III domain-containing protein [Gemmatimonadota bacterium]
MIRPLPYIPLLAACIILLDISSSHARSGSLSLGSGSGTPNQTFTVSVDMTNDTRIVGFQFDIVESVNAVDIVNVVIDSTHIDSTRQWNLHLNRKNAVTTKAVAFDFNLNGIPSGSGPFAEITYRVRSDVLSGTYPIHLRAVVLSDAGGGTIDDVTITDGSVTVVDGLEPDVTPPVKPVGLSAIPAHRKVALNWIANTEKDLDYYIVFRSNGGVMVPSPGDSIARIRPPRSDHVDQNLINGTLYKYFLIAVDNRGNKSDPTDGVSAVPFDLLPPNRPIGLRTVGGDRRVDLSWFPNTEVDLALYIIYRGLTSVNVDSLTEVTGTVTTYADTGLTNGTRYFYRLAAIDESGNRSQYGVAKDATPQAVSDTTQPATPQNLTARGGDGWIELHWQPTMEQDLSRYILYRSTQDGFSPGIQDSIASLAHFRNKHMDNGLTNGTRYYYRLVASDFSGNRSDPSHQVSAVPDVAPLVKRVIPGIGPRNGGTTVLIIGENFHDGATVKFGKGHADSVRFINTHNITARTPPNAPGRKDVTVTNPSGRFTTLRRGFLYTKVDSFTVIVKVTSQVDGQARVDTVDTATLPESLPYILPLQIDAPVAGLQPLYNALAGMALKIPPAAVVDNLTISLDIRNVIVRNDSTIFARVHGRPSFFSVDPLVSINGIERPREPFLSRAALHLTLKLSALNRILQESGIDSTIADSLAFAYVTRHGLTQEGMTSRLRYEERLLIGSLSRLGPMAGVLQRDIRMNNKPPVIIGGPFVTPGDTQALTTWRTNKLSTSRVEYGVDGNLSKSERDSSLVIGHAIVLKDLDPRTRYFYRVISVDALGKTTASGVRSFTMGNRPDITPPSFVVKPQVLAVSRNGAVLGWTTDEKSASTVEFGNTVDFGRIKSQERFTLRHVIGLSGLAPDTKHYALVSSRDQKGNVTAFADTITFTTLNKQEDRSPRIVRRPAVTALTPTTAIIQWRTDEPSSSLIYYREVGTEDTLQTTNANEEMNMEHVVTLTGLTADTRYRYSAVSTDDSGNMGRSMPRSFRTPAVEDTVPPVIVRGPAVLYRSDRIIAIGWVTNEISDGFVYYKGGPDSTFIPRGSERLSRRHLVIVGGLETNTKYTFAVTSTDPSGNTVVFPEGTVVSKPVGTTIRARILAVGNSGLTATTSDIPDNDPPVIISGPDVIARTSTSLTLSWETDEPSDSRVLYGTNLALSATDEDVVASHQVTITNLEAGTTYDFQVGSSDPGGNGPTFSSSGTATTTSTPDTEPPVIVPGTMQAVVSHDRITVYWETDEPSDTFVDYGVTPGALNDMEEESALVNSHSVVLVNLTPSATYYLHGSSTDLDGNGPTATATLVVNTTAEADTARPVISSVSRQALATTDTTSQLAVTWSTDILSTHLIEYGTTADLGLTIRDETSSTNHTITASRLGLNTRYYFRIGSASANDPQNERIAYSAVDSLITPAVPDTATPLAPENLTSVPGNGAVRIRWSVSTSDNVTGYRISRDGVAIGTVGMDTEYLDLSAVNGQSQTYSVQSISAVGNTSALPAGVSVVPNIEQVPTVPSNGSPATGDTVSLAPTLIVDNASPVFGDANRALLTYEFQVSTDIDFTMLTASATGISGGTSGNPTNWQIRDPVRPTTDLLENNVAYWWRARANDTEFTGDWSTPTLFITSTTIPTGISLATFAADEDRGVVLLDWAIAAGQEPEGFHVLRSLSQDRGFQRITTGVVSGTETGYTFTDYDVRVNMVYYYMLEAETTSDTFGPITIKVSPPDDFTL